MKNEQNNYILDEPLVTKNVFWWILGIVAVSGLVGGISGAKEFSMLVVWITLAVVALAAVVMLIENLLFFRRMRLRMDENRVWTRIPLMKDRSLAWKQIRTAAIVRLKNANYPAQIVLSIHEPEEALTRKRMVWKNAKRGEELRLPLNETRRAAIEQCLRMTLPEIEL